ncbi:MAG: hypothetical protein ACOH18_04685 [Candidatus Saccharimonadaceae bacterium]
MFRRTLIASLCAAFFIVGLSACEKSPVPTPKNPGSAIEAPEGWTQLSVEGEAVASPPSVENSMIVVSTPVDMTSVTDSATISGWELSDDLTYVVVTIRLSKDGWSSFAKLVELDETVDPSRLQLGEETARGLIDLDQLAADVIQHRVDRKVTPVDIRTIEAYYDLVVSNY